MDIVLEQGQSTSYISKVNFIAIHLYNLEHIRPSITIFSFIQNLFLSSPSSNYES